MELPNYFLADLPDNSTLTSGLIIEACRSLKRNRERYLLTRPTDKIIHVLTSVAQDWLDPEYPFRKMVLEKGPGETGFSTETIATGLNNFFAGITRENLERLILQDLGSARRLDEISADLTESKGGRASIAHGPELIAHFTGGALPNPALTSMVLGLLTKSSQFFKCASHNSYIPRMFAHSIYKFEPKLGSCLEIAEWKGGLEMLESPLCEEASCVTATGDDETLGKIRQRVPIRTRFLGYGHKVSFGYISREILSRPDLPEATASVAVDIVAWNQLGCLSPHVIYVESGGTIAPHDFASALGKELAEREKSQPRGPVREDVSAAIATRRLFYEVRASADEQTRMWRSEDSTHWTVIYEADPQWQSSCLNRFIYVKAVANLSQLWQAIAPIQSSLSTVGLAAPSHRWRELALEFARFGATRVCPSGDMQNPPLSWRHDGRPSLGDLVTWTDLEFK